MSPEDSFRKKKRPSDLSLPPTGKRDSPLRPSEPTVPPRPVTRPALPKRPNQTRRPQDQRGNAPTPRKGTIPRRPSAKKSRPAAPKKATKASSANSSSPALSLWQRFLLYTVRLLILGVGLGAIAGTFLSTIEATQQEVISQQTVPSSRSERPNHPLSEFANLPKGEVIEPLQNQIETLAEQFPQHELGVFLLDLDTGNYVNWNGRRAFASASTIKMPILVAFFQAVDADDIRLDEPLVMEENLMVGEAGTMQYDPPGTRYSALETVKKMVAVLSLITT
ncbi:MAG: hypothetical protein F6K03_10150, partial [Kamptonema sp. SIO4C4]|nr:hypothetical protein [Kamptonema sp. SIO4C4]